MVTLVSCFAVMIGGEGKCVEGGVNQHFLNIRNTCCEVELFISSSGSNPIATGLILYSSILLYPEMCLFTNHNACIMVTKLSLFSFVLHFFVCYRLGENLWYGMLWLQ